MKNLKNYEVNMQLTKMGNYKGEITHALDLIFDYKGEFARNKKWSPSSHKHKMKQAVDGKHLIYIVDVPLAGVNIGYDGRIVDAYIIESELYFSSGIDFADQLMKELIGRTVRFL